MFCRKSYIIFQFVYEGKYFHHELGRQQPRPAVCQIYDIKISVSMIDLKKNRVRIKFKTH